MEKLPFLQAIYLQCIRNLQHLECFFQDPHFNNPAEFNTNCQGLELFNDFTYTASYNPELALKPVEAPDFSIPCFNGK